MLTQPAKNVLIAQIITVLVLGVCFWRPLPVAGRAGAQESLRPTRLEITGVDTGEFPTLGLNLIVTDRQSRPRRQLGALRVRENGAPVADYEVVPVNVGTDLFLVIDANSRIQEADDEGGLTRLQTVKDSILSYAGRFMDLAERDRVTVIVPDGDGGRALAEDVSAPATLIEAVRPYDAGRLPQSDAIALLGLALEHAAAQKDAGRFQAIVLYTDASGLNEARLVPLVERAQALQAPIFVLILGGGATPSENAVAMATALTAPTRGFFAHMPAAADGSAVFQVIADNGVQSQVRYSSNIRRSGAHSLSVTLENYRDEWALDLELAPPRVALEVGQSTIRRAGTQPDTPAEDLQPLVQPLLAQITWPDELPRRLRGASLLANGEAQDAPFVGGPGAGDGDLLQFDWHIATLAAGRYELSVVVTDTLGMSSQSDGEAVVIEFVRPEPVPTPSPTATPAPLALLREFLPRIPEDVSSSPYLAPVGGVLLLLLLAALAVRRAQQQREDVEPAPPPFDEREEALESSAMLTNAGGERAYLKSLMPGRSRYRLERANVTIGRDEAQVQLYLPDRSISGLHARIRWRDGAYWLYDEGSQHGTYLNHERLGLAPRRLKDGDELQLGSVRLRFQIEANEDKSPAHVGRADEEGERT